MLLKVLPRVISYNKSRKTNESDHNDPTIIPDPKLTDQFLSMLHTDIIKLFREGKKNPSKPYKSYELLIHIYSLTVL